MHPFYKKKAVFPSKAYIFVLIGGFLPACNQLLLLKKQDYD